MNVKKAKCSKRFRGKGKFSNRNIRYMQRLSELPPEPIPLEAHEISAFCGLGKETKKVTKKDIIEMLEMDLSFSINQWKCIKPEWRKGEKEFYKTQDCSGELDYKY